MSTTDLSACSMIELFRIELEGQSVTLTEGLLALERDSHAEGAFEPLMRAAHSLKGAARIVGLDVAVRVAHAMEDFFVAAQNSKISVRDQEIDLLLRGVDLLTRIGHTEPALLSVWDNERAAEIETFLDGLRSYLLAKPATASQVSPASPAAQVPAVLAPLEPAPAEPPPPQIASPAAASPAPPAPQSAAGIGEKQDRVLRITAGNMNRLLGMVGESLVESRWLPPFAGSLTRLKRLQADIDRSLENLRENLRGHVLEDRAVSDLNNAQGKVAECRQFLSDRLHELEQFDRRSANLSQRLYRQVVDCRMRPFADGTHGFPRMIRELAQSLGKKIKFEIVGESTQVDRDILEKLEAPLTHLLRNAIDHGVETPAERGAAGKPPEATVRLEARHRAGMLQIVVADDGRGISFDKLRAAVAEKMLATADMAARLSEAELIEFLFLPGFSTKE
ncbi:MAG: Hpt domain-containing protein, partial [Verrucomicrobia bacterium]|nr:Hpt domain-containing protein [Verrucomicrobiota bacterium]